MLKLTWREAHLPNAKRWTLHAPGFSSPYRGDDAIGHVAHCGGRTYRAEANVDWEKTTFTLAGSPSAAAKRLERELGRLSIGWFGEDDIAFEGRP